MFAPLGMSPYDERVALFSLGIAALVATGLLVAAGRSRSKFLRRELSGFAVLVLLIGAVLFLLPQFSRVPPPEGRTATQNRLKNIVLAFHNYHSDLRGHLPDDIRDREGNALLSWRVAILPYIEEGELYKEFKLDEPWDGPNNIKLLAKMPMLYAPVLAKVEPGHTFFQCFKGPHAAFRPGNPRALTGADFPDGRSNTLLIAEGGEAVPWTKPIDLDFDPDGPLPPLGGAFRDYINVAFADGNVRSIRKEKIHCDRLPAWITPDGGEEHLPLDD
jgi:prepilin-type processing-associated H-X9-DG protein